MMTIASSTNIRCLFAMAALSAGVFAQSIAGVQTARKCTMVAFCNVQQPPRDCTPAQDTRTCGHTIQFLGSSTRIPDPVCEAGKAAQNQTYQVQAQACASRIAEDKAENEWKRQQCLAVAAACSVTLPMAESTKFTGARLLWVDDHRESNTYERQALLELGATIVTVPDTEHAMVQLPGEPKRFDAIISNFSRAGDPRAGYTLLKLVRHLTDPPPVVIYSESSTPSFATEARKRGAFGETNQPKELISLVIRSVSFHRHHELRRLVSTKP
jgi:hypothetical protein